MKPLDTLGAQTANLRRQFAFPFSASGQSPETAQFGNPSGSRFPFHNIIHKSNDAATADDEFTDETADGSVDSNLRNDIPLLTGKLRGLSGRKNGWWDTEGGSGDAIPKARLWLWVMLGAIVGAGIVLIGLVLSNVAYHGGAGMKRDGNGRGVVPKRGYHIFEGSLWC